MYVPATKFHDSLIALHKQTKNICQIVVLHSENNYSGEYIFLT